MTKSQRSEIEEAIRLIVGAADKLYSTKNGYSNYGRGLYELADEIQDLLDGEVVE